jgi:SAM-dependent methyltransferase
MTAGAGYYDRVNPDLLRRIPVNARTVLEVGCGAGALGVAFKAIQPEVVYVGLEQVEEAAALAAGRLDHVLRADAEDPELALPELPPLDCLIYGDVLEHLQDPWATLRRHAARLHDEGVLLACVPNVQHWSVLANLLQGRWPLAEEGLFDRTHLRWFTRDSLRELVASCGLQLQELTPRIFQRERAEAFVAQLEPALAGLGVDRQQLLEGVAPLQYVLRASRRPRPSLHLDCLTLRPQAGMVDVRILQPLRSLTSQPSITARAAHGTLELLPASSQLPRLLIWQRPSLSWPDSLEQLRRLLQNGYVVVVEYDDDPERWPSIAANHHLVFRGVHAVQVSTEPLAAAIRPHNPELVVFANALDALPPPVSFPEAGGGPLRLFFGALNREADWAPWIETLNTVLAEAPDRWQVEVVHDRSFFDALQLPNRRFTPTCDYATYRQVLGSCHIAFLPLADTPFNRCKSDLKALEAGGHGLAIAASPVVYGESLREGETGRLFRTAAELAAIMREWRADPASAQAMGQRARQWVAGSRLQHHQAAVREAWYRNLWERREALTAALLERLPELAGSGG